MTTETPEKKGPQDQGGAQEDHASELKASPPRGYEDRPDAPSRRTFFKRLTSGGGGHEDTPDTPSRRTFFKRLTSGGGGHEDTPDAPSRRTFFKRAAIGGGIFISGIIVAFPIFFGTMTAMVATSSPEFCGSCHEIKPAVQAWAGSTHRNNAPGLVAECIDCHLPPPEETFRFFRIKAYHGLKDVIFHFLRGSEGYNREEAREGMYQSVTNQVCLRCHQNVLYMPQNRGAMLAHRAVIYARAGYEKKCIDCHYDLVHNDPAAVMYRQSRRLPYHAKGLKPEKLGL